ncbi:MAG: GPW/gp25 family protein, partial [Anaerolineae bacterium]|nr:GPW/gp25 family protein [Anaerolineae bacterium]
MGQEFLGTGWKYPIQLDQHGDFALSSYEQSIQEAIWTILSIAPGERLMRPDFGCRIHELVFAPNDAAFAKIAQADLNAILADKELLTAILTYHVVPGAVFSK